jgi:phosphoribosylpyrophosphate synthetase
MSNIDYSKKYLKYKNKYYNSKYETNQLGGKCEKKYILLSCPEFNDLVDKMLEGNMDKELQQSVSEKNKYAIKEIEQLDKGNFNEINKSLKNFIEDLGTECLEKNIESIMNMKDKLKKEYPRSTVQVSSQNFYKGYINWSYYGDKTPNIKMNKETVIRLKGSKVIFFAYFSFNEDNKDTTSIITQLLFLNSLNHYGVAEINIVLPYFPVGTMERIVGEGEIPTAYSLAHMLNMIPCGASKNNLYVFDIHALCSRFFFHTNTRPVLISMMPDYLTEMKKIEETSCGHVIVVFPDDGAKKRFEKLLPKEKKIKTITCSKIRKAEDRIIKIDSGIENLYVDKIEGGKILDGTINLFLIDDLVQSGSTILEAFRGLFVDLVQKGFKAENIKCYAVITHAVLPDEKKTNSFFDATVKLSKEIYHTMNITLITTNSRPLRIKELENASYKEKVRVLPLTKALLATFTNDCKVNDYVAPFSIN